MPANPTTFLMKIASRCNLACDYCYVYNHADQSWRGQPAVMSVAHRRVLARRLAEYAIQEQVQSLTIIFHGGEPLLAGVYWIIAAAREFRQALPYNTSIILSLQTNGTLLDEAAVLSLANAGIWISLSID